MYPAPAYHVTDIDQIVPFMERFPFATLIATGADGLPVATQVPTLVHRVGSQVFVRAHVMRGTDHFHALLPGGSAFLLFSGPHCHVSASWYTNPLSGSTWNYMTAHARGTVRHMSENELRALLRDLTNGYEDGPDTGANWEDLPEEYIQRMLPAIVGIEVCVTSLEAVFKLSQKHDDTNRRRIIERLRQRGGDSAGVAGEMERIFS